VPFNCPSLVGTLVGCIFVFFPIVLFSLFLIVTFAFSSGRTEKFYSIVWTFLSYTVSLTIAGLVFFMFPSNRTKRKVKYFAIFFVVGLIIYFGLVQVALSFILPPSCIVSNSLGEISVGAENINLLSSRGLLLQAELKCNYTDKLIAAKAFFGCALWVEPNLYFGGLPTHFHNAYAMTIKNHIFIQSPKCMSVPGLVHEMTHVWQFQQGLWFGEDSIPKLFDWLEQQATNRTGMYNYGGESGLQRFVDAGKHFLDFNFEQQASIIEDYYTSKTESTNFSEKYKKLLADFSNEVLTNCKKM